ncbi:MAG: methyltransferase domain-containing protein [Deltaproteobacteria bacterium]|nr:methyltransferase domain-containing protein [Deltaproteobacteria bacterium]
MLLARFAAERPVARAADLGSGSGVVALCLLALGGAEEAVGVEFQEEMAERACRSARWNGWPERARFLSGDVRAIRDLLPGGTFPLVVANPPYRPLSSGRVSPEPSCAVARHEVACRLEDVLAAAAYLLEDRGELCVVYPARRLAALLEGCRAARLEPSVLRLVHPRAGEPASLALLRCRKGGTEGLEVRWPLALHPGPGEEASGERYSAEAARLLGPPGVADVAAPAPPEPSPAGPSPSG